MILWFVLTVMLSIAAVFVSAPFIRRQERKRLTANADVAVYRDQLKEVEREVAQGAIDATQAEAARTEIKRRILAATEQSDSTLSELSGGERTFAAIAVAAIVTAGSVGLFALTDDLEPRAAPSAKLEVPLPVVPQEKRAPEPPRLAATAGGGDKPARTALPPVDELIQRILVRLQRNPKDVQGWRMLGWSYYSTDRFAEAAAAYARAIELEPESAEFHNGRAEALIRAAKGVVTPEARSLIEGTLQKHPKDSRARYLDGLATEQAGDKAGARQKWNDLLKELDPNDPWTKELAQRIAAKDKGETPAAADASSDNAPSGARESSDRTSGDRTSEKGPSAEDIRAADQMTPSDRAAMIRRMVDQLAARLDAAPDDADGWIKLLRSLSVLGDADRAKAALDKARKAFANAPNESKRITATAEELGIAR